MALDNDIIDRSPVRKKHKPETPRKSKPAWTSDQVRKIIEEFPAEYHALFTVIALTALCIGEVFGIEVGLC